jgi:lysophospholipase L1-like esterase
MPVKKLVILGDSITDCGRARPVGEGLPGALGNGYVNLFDAMAQVDHPAWKLRVVNMGTDGETSRDLLARWDTDCDALEPDIVAVLIGINDVWRQFDSPYRGNTRPAGRVRRQPARDGAPHRARAQAAVCLAVLL